MEALAIKGLISGTYETLTVVRPKVLRARRPESLCWTIYSFHFLRKKALN